jgi:hypothetical protein
VTSQPQLKIGETIPNSESVKIDLQRLLEGRLLLQANSGGGKSYAVRKLCEITHGHIQQIVLDPEGEFATLREKLDYILIGKDGDIPINLRASELLARKILELGTSAIIDLYELKHNERKRFVKLFLDSLVNAPKKLWHPCIIVLDEAHVFAPESSHGQAESLDSVKDLATRGRKRGFALVAATQRLSKLSKDVVAELNTKLIGRSALDVDMKRAGFELGFTSKEDLFSLRQLEKGQFFAFGPALTAQVTKIKIGLCKTKHPQAGQIQKNMNIAPRAKIQQILSKLSDLPKEAEETLKTTEDLKKKIISLNREISSLKKNNTTKIDHESMFRLKELYRKKILQYEESLRDISEKYRKLQNTFDKLEKILMLGKTEIEKPKENSITPKPLPQINIMSDVIPKNPKPHDMDYTESEPKKLREGAMKMLRTVALFHPYPITKQRLRS